LRDWKTKDSKVATVDANTEKKADEPRRSPAGRSINKKGKTEKRERIGRRDNGDRGPPTVPDEQRFTLESLNKKKKR